MEDLVDALAGIPLSQSCLDHGRVTLVDCIPRMRPHDRTLEYRAVEAARMSFGRALKSKIEDARLFEYLLEHGHTSPCEQIQFTFSVECPLFVLGHIVRHRTAKLNVFSQRYAEVLDKFYLPEKFVLSSTSSAQGGSEENGFDEQTTNLFRAALQSTYQNSYETYLRLLKQGVTREQARIVLPSATYTSLIITFDLNNLLKFFTLRCAPECQYETRVFACAMRELVTPLIPSAIRLQMMPRFSFNSDEIEMLTGRKKCSERKRREIQTRWNAMHDKLEPEKDDSASSIFPDICQADSTYNITPQITLQQEETGSIAMTASI